MEASCNLQEKDVNALKAIIVDRDEKIKVRDEEIMLLRERLRLLQAKLFGPKTEKLNSLIAQEQLALFEIEEPVEETDNEEDEHKETITYERKKRGRKPLPDWLPREEVVHDLPEDEKACPCGAPLSCIGKDEWEELKYIPAVIKVLHHIQLIYACCRCKGEKSDGPKVTTAPAPARLIPKSIAGESLLAHVMTGKFADALPFYRQNKQLARLGIDISRSTMCNWTKKIGDWLGPLWNMLLEEAKLRGYIQIDETTFQVMKEKGRDNRSKSYVWVIRAGPPGKPIILFKYDPSRSGTVAADLLAGYRGIVQTDGYKGYSFLEDWDGVAHAGCWDHVRRKFADAVKVGGKYRKSKKLTYADKALAKIRKLYQIEKRATHEGLDIEARYELRQSETKPHLEKFHKWLQELQPKALETSLLGKAISYTLKQWPKLLVFLDHGYLPVSNQGVENAIRPLVIGRKNFLFSGHPTGAQASMRIYSIVETAKAAGWDPFAYLNFLFHELPKAESAEHLQLLLPTNPPSL